MKKTIFTFMICLFIHVLFIHKLKQRLSYMSFLEPARTAVLAGC